jgi:hypothetical protein
MPLVHRLWGIGYASIEEQTPRTRERPPTYPGLIRPSTAAGEADTSGGCRLCAAGAATFDLSMRCCLDRYESLFGSMSEHRKMFARAKTSALEGDLQPARRLVESYRRVFGPMAAVELKRTLWQAIEEAQLRPLHPRAPAAAHEAPR